MGNLEKFDIYNCKRKLQLAQENIRSSPKISESNKRDILAFNDYCFAEGLGVDRVIHYTWILKKLAEKIDKDFRVAKKQDITKLVTYVEARKIFECCLSGRALTVSMPKDETRTRPGHLLERCQFLFLTLFISVFLQWLHL